jgi:hypothetical protein
VEAGELLKNAHLGKSEKYLILRSKVSLALLGLEGNPPMCLADFWNVRRYAAGRAEIRARSITDNQSSG